MDLLWTPPAEIDTDVLGLNLPSKRVDSKQ